MKNRKQSGPQIIHDGTLYYQNDPWGDGRDALVISPKGELFHYDGSEYGHGQALIAIKFQGQKFEEIPTEYQEDWIESMGLGTSIDFVEQGWAVGMMEGPEAHFQAYGFSKQQKQTILGILGGLPHITEVTIDDGEVMETVSRDEAIQYLSPIAAAYDDDSIVQEAIEQTQFSSVPPTTGQDYKFIIDEQGNGIFWIPPFILAGGQYYGPTWEKYADHPHHGDMLKYAGVQSDSFAAGYGVDGEVRVESQEPVTKWAEQLYEWFKDYEYITYQSNEVPVNSLKIDWGVMAKKTAAPYLNNGMVVFENDMQQNNEYRFLITPQGEIYLWSSWLYEHPLTGDEIQEERLDASHSFGCTMAMYDNMELPQRAIEKINHSALMGRVEGPMEDIKQAAGENWVFGEVDEGGNMEVLTGLLTPQQISGILEVIEEDEGLQSVWTDEETLDGTYEPHEAIEAFQSLLMSKTADFDDDCYEDRAIDIFLMGPDGTRYGYTDVMYHDAVAEDIKHQHDIEDFTGFISGHVDGCDDMAIYPWRERSYNRDTRSTDTTWLSTELTPEQKNALSEYLVEQTPQTVSIQFPDSKFEGRASEALDYLSGTAPSIREAVFVKAAEAMGHLGCFWCGKDVAETNIVLACYDLDLGEAKDNLVPCCDGCASKRGDKDPQEMFESVEER